MLRKPLLGAALLAAATFGMGANAAFAGEITGNGKDLPVHGKSLCAYSGQNDNPDDPEEGGRVQSYGQVVKAGFKEFAPSPGVACNPTKGFEE